MNRLWVQLSVAFSAVILVSAVTISAISAAVAAVAVRQVPDGLATQLQAYYRIHNSWGNLDVFLSGVESALPPGPHFVFAMRDTDGRLYHSVGQPDNDDSVFTQIPLIIDGQARGLLTIWEKRPPPEPDGRPFLLDRLRDFLLLFALIGGGIGIVSGVLVSRSLAAPLDRLAAAAQAIAAHDLTRRVTLSGSREMVAVGSAFNDMAIALEDAETLRRNLVADVAHELRTPLSVLQGNLLAILDGVYPLDTGEIARLYDQTHVLTRLVNDLHELSLADAHQLHLHPQPTDIRRLLENIVAAFMPTAEAAHMRLALDAAPGLPAVSIDTLRLTQILDNLIGNALRHTASGGTITVCAAAPDAALILTVSDTGEGIVAEHLPHVFDRFYRTHRDRSRATGGAGLGLAIVRALVEMHGGQIRVASAGIPGQGTTFTITLPLPDLPLVRLPEPSAGQE